MPSSPRPKKKKVTDPRDSYYGSSSASTPSSSFTWNPPTEYNGRPVNQNVADSHQPFMDQIMRANVEDGFDSAGRVLPFPAMDDPRPTYNPTGGGGGGGGGGGSAAKSAGLVAGGLQQLLQSKMFQAGDISGDLAKVDSAVSADQAANDGAYAALAKYLGGMGNAYQGMEQTASPMVSPELLGLLGQSGIDTRGYQGQVGLANTLAAQGDAAGQRLGDQMGEVASEANRSRLAETEMARTFGSQQLASQKTAMQTALEQRQRDEQKGLDGQRTQIVLQLIQAMADAGQPIDIAQFLQ